VTIKYFYDICGEEIIDSQHPWVKMELHTPPMLGRLFSKTKYIRTHLSCITNTSKLKKLTGDIDGGE